LQWNVSSGVLIPINGLRRKFIDPTGQLPQHLTEMFAKPVKPMNAAALKRVAWHFIVPRRVF